MALALSLEMEVVMGQVRVAARVVVQGEVLRAAPVELVAPVILVEEASLAQVVVAPEGLMQAVAQEVSINLFLIA